VAVSFEPAAPVERPKMKLNKPKVAASAPKSTTRIVTKVKKSSMPSMALPEMDSYGFAGSGVAAGQSQFSNEQYDLIVENAFKASMQNPLSTFSIDVDRAAYANVRRFLTNDQQPPMDAVRIEEMVNYFDYDYPQPKGSEPFVVSTEIGECPWNEEHQLALIGLQGVDIETADLPPNNLVFLLDVSGSMNSRDKLPLLKSAMRLLVEQMRPEDRVSIVVYAGAAGVVLEPTADKAEILEAIKRLNAGGSTAGGAGIELAYKLAKQEFMKNGNNRVILATDGDFNVGISSDGDLVRMIEEKRNSGIYLTVLGFGTGNYKDSKMEKLADKGNGNYAYIDDILEAKKVLVNEMGGTLVTIAKDVKIQIEFNPKHVKGYRLIGYENRMLAKEDFNDDRKDAGELGAGHTVTALYELIPMGADLTVPVADSLKYQKTQVVDSDELMTVKLRYKNPDEDESRLIKRAVAVNDVYTMTNSGNLAFASAVAEFGMLLRDSQYKGSANFEDVLERAKAFKGADDEGYRAEFIRLVEKAELLYQEK
jgi:Ca-activated chloride channel family protein